MNAFFSLFSFKLIAALTILLFTLLSGLWPFFTRKPEWQCSRLEALASGVFLGAALLHMLPDSVHGFMAMGYHYPYPFLILGSVFLLLLLIEQYQQFSGGMILLSTLLLSIHSFLEGAALGVSLFSTALLIFIAIMAHKGAASFALATQINRSHFSLKIRGLTFAIFASMTPLGIFMGSFVIASSHSQLSVLTPIFNAMAAGTFLYIGTLHGLEQSPLIRHCRQLSHFFYMLMGFVFMALLAVWI